MGAHLMAGLSRDHHVLGVDRHPWWGDRPLPLLIGDLLDPSLLERAIGTHPPDILIHCAALTDVDGCEKDPAKAYALNSDLTQAVAWQVPPSCAFVYISTDSLFSGEEAFATESQTPYPKSIYAKSKWRGERAVEAATSNHLIIRTNFYGWSSGRKVTAAEWMYAALAKSEPVTFFDDLFLTPIYVVDFVEQLRSLIQSGRRGIFHLVGRDRVSKYRFGELMAKTAGLSFEHVTRGSFKNAPLIAPRPNEMSLSSERFETATGISVPDCLTGLRRFLADRAVPLSQRCDGSILCAKDATT